ncbi:MAG: hypothetical protein U5Q44_08625 [Dehalococcoidia bacterium]|nr:hypothetical protein [Dehalococcoidia bacterium]
MVYPPTETREEVITVASNVREINLQDLRGARDHRPVLSSRAVRRPRRRGRRGRRNAGHGHQPSATTATTVAVPARTTVEAPGPGLEFETADDADPQ